MTEITISLSDIQNIKTVNIEGLGVLKIRKLGSGEDLDLSVKRRRINKLVDELDSIYNRMGLLDLKKPSDEKKFDKLSKQAEELGDEISEIKRYEFETYKRLLSDDKNGAVVDVIMNTLSDKERAEIFNIAFGEKKIVETPDLVDTEDVAEGAKDA